MSRLTRDVRPKPSRETKFSGANGDREMFVFPVQLTMSRIGNLTRLIHTLLYEVCDYHAFFDALAIFTSTPRASENNTI